MPTPSLLIVPARFKSGKLYSQIPTSGAGDFTVTRATSATRVNASGLIESVASGIPRLDYLASDGTVGCPALLVELIAQNLVLQSEDFTASSHIKFNLNAFGSGSVANTTATLDPYGTNVADYIQENSTASAVHGIIDIYAGIVSGTTYTWSVFAKAGERTIINLFDNSGSGGNATFNLTTGVATLNAGVSASMQNYGNGWWRCRFTYTATITGNFNVQIRLCNASGNSSYNGTGNQGVYIFGAQLETGSVATSYIPTTTAAVTRNADVVSVSGAVSGSIGQTQGTIYAELDIRNLTTADFARIVTLRETANANNFFEIEKRSSTQLRISARLNSGTTTTFLTHPNAFQLGTNKIAFAYQDGNYAMGFNGVVATSSQAGMTASLNQVILGSSSSSVAQLNDRIRAVALYTTRLTNAELAALTA